MNFKQLFCRHSFKRVSFNFIKSVREKTGYHIMGLPVYANFNYFTEFFICDKCKREIHKHTKYLRTDHQSSVLY